MGGTVLRRKIVIIFNILLVAFTLLGLGIMLYLNGNEGGLLSSSGWENLKYFTVLSNVFCGIVAVIFLLTQVFGISGKGGFQAKRQTGTDGPTVVLKKKVQMPGYPLWLLILKLTAAAAVMVTFLVVACFFGPIYGYGQLYLSSNLWFHLIIPLLAMVEFCLLDGKLPFRMTFLTGVPAFVYGCVYLGNILINGKGEWPNTNDWYGFLNWGYGPAAMIFAGIILTSFGAACLLRWINSKINK